MNRSVAYVVVASWLAWPIGLVLSIWNWDARYGLIGFVAALVGTAIAWLDLETAKRLSPTPATEKDAQ